MLFLFATGIVEILSLIFATGLLLGRRQAKRASIVDTAAKCKKNAALTQRGDKVLVSVQRLGAAFVLVVPNPQGLVVAAAEDEAAAGVDQHAAHPVIVAHLRQKNNSDGAVKGHFAEARGSIFGLSAPHLPA